MIRCSITIIYLLLIVSQNLASDTLRYADFIEIVKAHHPLLKQADLLDERSSAYLLKAKGELDPKVYFDSDNKQFDDKNYFRKLGGTLSVPTTFGADFKVAYERNSGVFVNPENSLPAGGLISAGIQFSLARGLLFDERRHVINESKLLARQNEFVRLQLVNELLFDASRSYVEWMISHQKLIILNRAILLAEDRLNNTVLSVLNGDKPAIDTVEAELGVFQRQNDLIDQEREYYSKRMKVSTFLWMDGNIPLVLDTLSIPSNTLEPISESVQGALALKEELLFSNPMLSQIELNNEFYANEKRLLKEDLKPQIDVYFNPLLESNQDIISNFSAENTKFGVSASYAIFNRKAKGELQLIDIKREENNLKLLNTKQKINIQLLELTNNITLYQDQRNTISSIALNYEKLLAAENEKFKIGESSMFLINNRELKFVDAQKKILEIDKRILFTQLNILLLLQALETVDR